MDGAAGVAEVVWCARLAPALTVLVLAVGIACVPAWDGSSVAVRPGSGSGGAEGAEDGAGGKTEGELEGRTAGRGEQSVVVAAWSCAASLIGGRAAAAGSRLGEMSADDGDSMFMVEGVSCSKIEANVLACLTTLVRCCREMKCF